jgi:hypothetical protein
VTEEKKRKILEEEDFIDYPKFKNSANKLTEKYPEGVEDELIAKVLHMSKEEVDEIYQESIRKIQRKLNL